MPVPLEYPSILDEQTSALTIEFKLQAEGKNCFVECQFAGPKGFRDNNLMIKGASVARALKQIQDDNGDFARFVRENYRAATGEDATILYQDVVDCAEDKKVEDADVLFGSVKYALTFNS